MNIEDLRQEREELLKEEYSFMYEHDDWCKKDDLILSYIEKERYAYILEKFIQYEDLQSKYPDLFNFLIRETESFLPFAKPLDDEFNKYKNLDEIIEKVKEKISEDEIRSIGRQIKIQEIEDKIKELETKKVMEIIDNTEIPF